MDDTGFFDKQPTRRRWVAHCTALLAAVAGMTALPALPAGPSRPTASEPRDRATAPTRILIVGDSLSAEYGLQRGSGWVALLEKRLAEEGFRAKVVNASVSGETTAGGRSRLPALLKQHQPQIVILELGGNDALRGLPLDTSGANLAAMARASKSAGARVLVLGLQVPPNYGSRYGEQFAAIYRDVARQEGTALVPFMLKGVADVPEAESLFQPDRIHPVAAAQPKILANVWPVLEALLKA